MKTITKIWHLISMDASSIKLFIPKSIFIENIVALAIYSYLYGWAHKQQICAKFTTSS